MHINHAYLRAQITLLLWAFFLPTLCAAEELIICGDDAYPPYSYLEEGKPAGIYVDIMNAILKKMDNYNVKIILRPWKRALLLAEKNEIFAIFPPYFRPETRPWLVQYSNPILKEDYTIICRKEVFADYPRNIWPDDYKNLTIGINHGFAIPGLQSLRYEEAKDGETNFKKMLNGRIDCYANDSNALVFYSQQLGKDAARLQFGVKISSEDGYLAVTEAKPAAFRTAFLEQFNIELQKLRATGELDFIIRSYFIR